MKLIANGTLTTREMRTSSWKHGPLIFFSVQN